jgi:hypothetical protein
MQLRTVVIFFNEKIMKSYIVILLSIFIASGLYSANRINYLQPVPDAKYVNTENSVTIGFDTKIDLPQSEILKCIKVIDSDNNFYMGTITKCEDDKTIIFNHALPFVPGKKISVKIDGKLLKTFSLRNEMYEYSFYTAKQKVNWNPLNSIEEEIPQMNDALPVPPELYVTMNNNPSDGFLFLTPFSGTSFLEITDKNAQPYWYLQANGFCGDFKEQPNGNLTYYNGELHKHFELDYNYNKIDSFQCGNGYVTDIHELRILINGHALLLAYDPEFVDMSLIVPGGNPNATVTGLIIQELDENKNVVFQWRSWDHFLITDALHENLLANNIDCVHGNAIEKDNDGNLIISSRHLDEITKINRSNGNIIWRLGGLHNQFTFINDTLHFNYQHAVRRISNGNITIYDAVEYSIDEVNKTATLVWQYRNNPDIFGSWGGYVQRLENGNTFISWGGISPAVSEVKPNGALVFSAVYPAGVYTYRAYKFNYNGSPVSTGQTPLTAPQKYSLNQNYPNPFNPSTIIKYSIKSSSYVELYVTDAAGRIVKILASSNQQAGDYSVSFDGSNFASGIYFYTLSAGGYSETKKMILMK